jgi:hypothetical protein
MRRVNAFLLTALVCVNLFGFYAMFMVRQAELKDEMSEITASLSIHHEILTFSRSEFSQLSFNDNGKEFRLNGSLYDVVSIQNSGENVIVTVEFDSKETALVDSFGGMLIQQHDKDQSSSPLKTVISHFQQDYLSNQHTIQVDCNTSTLKYYESNRTQHIPTFEANNLTPPPQFFIV